MVLAQQGVFGKNIMKLFLIFLKNISRVQLLKLVEVITPFLKILTKLKLKNVTKMKNEIVLHYKIK